MAAYVFDPRLFVFLAVVAATMLPMERLFPLRRDQKVVRNGWRTDTLHFILSTLLTRFAAALLIVSVAALLGKFVVNPEFQWLVARQPTALQFAEAVVIYDFAAYWAHRLAHVWPWLWRFHSVHHSSSELDWLSSTRLHFFDDAIQQAARFVPIYLLGFSSATFGFLALFGPFLAFVLHANARLSLGPLRWIYISPQYHHWHHALEPRDKNFAFSLPVFDLLFGTAHCPKGEWPTQYGVAEPMPASWLGQVAHPFRWRRPARSLSGST